MRSIRIQLHSSSPPRHASSTPSDHTSTLRSTTLHCATNDVVEPVTLVNRSLTFTPCHSSQPPASTFALPLSAALPITSAPHSLWRLCISALMDIAAADESTLTGVDHTLAAIVPATSHSPHSATASTSAAVTTAAVGPLTSKYSYTVCERCHKLGHTAQHCASNHTAAQHKKKHTQSQQQHQPQQPQQHSVVHKHKAAHQPAQPVPSIDASSTTITTNADEQRQQVAVVEDEDAAAMMQQLSMTAAAIPSLAATPAAVRASPYGEHMLPLCFVCEQRHDFGQCRKTKR